MAPFKSLGDMRGLIGPLWMFTTSSACSMECSEPAAWTSNSSLLMASCVEALPRRLTNSDSTLPRDACLEGGVIGCHLEGGVIGCHMEGGVIGCHIEGGVIGCHMEGGVIGCHLEGGVIWCPHFALGNCSRISQNMANQSWLIQHAY